MTDIEFLLFHIVYNNRSEAETKSSHLGSWPKKKNVLLLTSTDGLEKCLVRQQLMRVMDEKVFF